MYTHNTKLNDQLLTLTLTTRPLYNIHTGASSLLPHHIKSSAFLPLPSSSSSTPPFLSPPFEPALLSHRQMDEIIDADLCLQHINPPLHEEEVAQFKVCVCVCVSVSSPSLLLEPIPHPTSHTHTHLYSNSHTHLQHHRKPLPGKLKS